MHRRWLASAVLLLCATAGRAETYVVCAGVEQYEDARIGGLKYAVADARAIAAAFRAAGTPPANVTLLGSDQRDSARRPTRIALLRALRAVREQATPQDRFVFFFAGHGVEQGQGQYLLTVDTERDLLADTALPLSLVRDALAGLQAGEVLCLIDACRNDPQAGRGEADAQLSESFARGLRPTLAAAGGPRPRVWATLLACEVGQRAWEDPAAGHGAFTAALMRGLAGALGPGEVRLSALAAYVQREVSLWAQRQGRQQTPKLVNPDGDMAVLTPPAEPVVSVSLANQPLAEVIRQLGEQYGAQIVLGEGVDPEVKVTGRLEAQPLSVVLKVLVAAHKLSVRREGAVFVVEARTASAPMPTPAGPPPGWPAYLAGFQPPAGRTWSDYRVAPVDGMPQAWLPAGELTCGATPEQIAEANAMSARVDDNEFRQRRHGGDGPAVRVALDGFWADMHEVTVGQYRRFCQATGRGLPNVPPETPELMPIGDVTWHDAQAYAAWAGRGLPSQHQYERMARGGLEGAKYPWGADETPPARVGNITDESFLEQMPNRRVANRWFVGYRDGYGFAAPVCSFDPNPFGLYDLVGNLWEWAADRLTDPARPGEELRAYRGASFYHPPVDYRVAAHEAGPPTNHFGDLGFRCVSATLVGTPVGAPVAAASPTTKAWHVDASRHLVDGAGQRQFPVAVHLTVDRPSPDQAERAAAGMKALGIELVWLEVIASFITDGDPGPNLTGLAPVDAAVAACRRQGLKVILVPAVQHANGTTAPDRPLWSSPVDQERYLHMLAELARHYRAEAQTVVGMGLLAFPTPGAAETWRDLALRAIAAIRNADPDMPIYPTAPFGKEAEWQLPLPDNAMLGGCAVRHGVPRAAGPGHGAFVTISNEAAVWEAIRPEVVEALAHGYVPCLWPMHKFLLSGWADGQAPAEFEGFKQAVLEARRQMGLPAVSAAPANPAGLEFVSIPAGEGVAAFEMSKYPVTVAQFRRFVEATHCVTTAEQQGWGSMYANKAFRKIDGLSWRTPYAAGRPAIDDHPVVQLTKTDVLAFLKWAGGRLPTNAEWTWASRGGLAGAKYAWGNDWPPPKGLGNYADASLRREFPDYTQPTTAEDDGFACTSPVGTYRPNGYGLYDMIGNVCERLGDQPDCCKPGWGDSLDPKTWEVTFRWSFGDGLSHDLGFRMVRDVAP